jgi:phytanoyl-CoA dioxygenase PhyH
MVERQFHELVSTLPAVDSSFTNELNRLGYMMLPGIVPAERIAELRESFDRWIGLDGQLAGSEPGCLRLWNCVNKGDAFLRATFFAPVLAAAVAVIRRPFKLHGYNARNPLLGGGGQAFHRDVDTGPQLERRQTNGAQDLINAIWVLDDFTQSNGATRVIPGSHLHDRDIYDEMDDPTTTHSEEALLTAPAGTIIIVNGALWHSGTTNNSGQSRRSLHVSFVERHYPQQVEQRTHIEQKTLSSLSSTEKYLLDV